MSISWVGKRYRWFKSRSLSWICKRLLNEWQSPTKSQTKWIKRVFSKKIDGNHFSKLVKSETLFYIIDLQLVPIAFDNAIYLALAELERRRKGLESIHIIIVPGYSQGLRLELDEYDSVVNINLRKWRLNHLVFPLFQLISSVKSYSYFQSRLDALDFLRIFALHIFPRDWSNNIPSRPARIDLMKAARSGEKIFPMFSSPPGAIEYVEQYLGGFIGSKKLIVITLRSYEYTPERNSNIKDWVRFAKELNPSDFYVVFLLDVETSLDPVPNQLIGMNIFLAGSWNLHLRMAIYERAYLNMAIAQGPMELMFHNERCKYLIFMPVNSAPLTSIEPLIAEGFIIGENLPFSRKGQHIFWGWDNYENITSEFYKLIKILES